MNAKDLNLASHLDEILQSGVVDALKIEGRTKSPYYVAATAKAYRAGIDDFYAGHFEREKYVAELNTTKNRGFSDGYLINRPFEKDGDQNLDVSIVEGSHQVYALVNEDGMSFKAKDKVEPNLEYEVMLPLHVNTLEPCDNEIGALHVRDGKTIIIFKKIMTVKGKEMDAVHSGNVNDIQLPCALPYLSFFRREVIEQ